MTARQRRRERRAYNRWRRWAPVNGYGRDEAHAWREHVALEMRIFGFVRVDYAHEPAPEAYR